MVAPDLMGGASQRARTATAEHRVPVTVPAEVAAAALRAKAHRELSLWLLARCAPGADCGHLRREHLEAQFVGFVQPRTARAWVGQLLASGLATERHARSGEPTVVLASIRDVIRRYRVASSRHSVVVEARHLAGRARRQYLTCVARAPRGARPTARDTVTAMTGVSKTTQRRGERRHHATVQPAVLRHRVRRNQSPDSLPRVDLPSVRVADGETFQQLPNTTAFPSIVVRRRRRHCPEDVAGQPTPRRRRYLGPTERSPKGQWVDDLQVASLFAGFGARLRREDFVILNGRQMETWTTA